MRVHVAWPEPSGQNPQATCPEPAPSIVALHPALLAQPDSALVTVQFHCLSVSSVLHVPNRSVQGVKSVRGAGEGSKGEASASKIYGC